MMIKPNVRARYTSEGQNYNVEFRSCANNVNEMAVLAAQLIEQEYGINADANKIALHIF